MLPLYKPLSYINTTSIEKKRVCNGCGAKDGIKVPSTFYGLDIEEACNIHDWMYEIGETLGDYYFANIIFFWNMIAIVINNSNKFMMLLRCERALKYFIAVSFKSGRQAFFVDKVANYNKTITIKGKFL